MYEVLTSFTDKNTSVVYKQGDKYPAQEVSYERLEELTTENNALGKVIIKQSDYPAHTGGGWYFISNGEKVQGYDKALKAEYKLSGE